MTKLDKIRKDYMEYIKRREVFDTNKGLLAPIRAILLRDVRHAYYYSDQAAVHEGDQWKRKSQPIGYLAAVKNQETGVVEYGWSLCNLYDIEEFDSITGKLIALRRLDKDHSPNLDSLEAIDFAGKEFESPLFADRYLFFANHTIKAQIHDFVNRCDRYFYKGFYDAKSSD